MPEPQGQLCLVVDDAEEIRMLLGLVLERAGYRCLMAADIDEARAILASRDVDCVLLDIVVPGGGGLRLLRELQRERPEVAVVMVTGRDDPDLAGEAFKDGAYGYVVKPFQSHEVRLAVQNALRRRGTEDAHRAYQARLEAEVAARTQALRTSRAELATRLAGALELRDHATGMHTERMSRYSVLIGQQLGLDGAELERLGTASPLHDIGKIGIPDRILRKTEPLTADEWAVMKTHTTLGHALLKDSTDEVVTAAAAIALSHHERWQGGGYPSGLVGAATPLFGRIAAVADVFDAATSDRTYRRALPVDDVVELILAGRGTLFDPDVVDAFGLCERRARAIAGASCVADSP